MLLFHVPNDIKKLREQKKALEWLLTQDTNEKDKQIHKQALEAINKALLKFN
ncbi:hypothetical protein [Bacillus paralicheniformis]|uniref:hypothetical protein n=1 Tax=Bacillus paralicheniformis TaxID=1648923 RepID=UPI002DB99AE9|nr:hypothetical protein [Bacillus paralicheniformis]MEC1866729.1 hypothetical protein [Bacillus paralicheniformis]